jgi:hypothetical protein
MVSTRHIHNRADGFKRELTEAGGQGAGVYGHVYFQGGAKLGGIATNMIGGWPLPTTLLSGSRECTRRHRRKWLATERAGQLANTYITSLQGKRRVNRRGSEIV